MIFKELENFSEDSPYYPPPSDFSIPKEEFSKKREQKVIDQSFSSSDSDEESV